MKKLTITIIFGIIFCVNSHAQLNIGLKHGFLTFNELLYKNPNGFDKPGQKQGMYSMNGGIFVNYKFKKKYSLQAEFVFNTLGTKFYQQDFYYTNGISIDKIYISNNFKVQMQYLELPIIGKISFGNKVTFDMIAGAFVGTMLTAKQSTDNNLLYWPQDTLLLNSTWPTTKVTDYLPQNVRSQYTLLNAGVLLGYGMTINDRLFLEMRLSRGLVNIRKDGPTKINTLQAQLTIGYFILRQKRKA